LAIPELETRAHGQWRWLAERPHPWRRQLWVKGCNPLASALWLEIASFCATYSNSRGVTIIGDPVLAGMYARVFADRGTPTRRLIGADCSIAGLRYLREHGS
jgi:hypothetical protein